MKAWVVEIRWTGIVKWEKQKQKHLRRAATFPLGVFFGVRKLEKFHFYLLFQFMNPSIKAPTTSSVIVLYWTCNRRLEPITVPVARMNWSGVDEEIGCFVLTCLYCLLFVLWSNAEFIVFTVTDDPGRELNSNLKIRFDWAQVEWTKIDFLLVLHIVRESIFIRSELGVTVRIPIARLDWKVDGKVLLFRQSGTSWCICN